MSKKSTVLYYVVQSQYGRILVATKDATLVAFLFLAENDEKMMKIFFSKFPNATECNITNFTHILQNVLNGNSVMFELNGSDFQKSVWTELLKVKNVISYQELANRIGSPKAVRAAANAVAKNLLHVVVPCHLVVRSSGDIGKYAGGVAIKQALIEKLSFTTSFST